MFNEPRQNPPAQDRPPRAEASIIQLHALLGEPACERTVARLPSGEELLLVGIPNATIFGKREPLVFTERGSARPCVFDCALLARDLEDRDLPLALKDLAHPGSVHERTIARPALFLAGPGAQEPYHWLHDALPRLLALEMSKLDVAIIVPAPTERNRFISESLALLGISPDRVECVKADERVLAHKLWIAEDLFSAPTKHSSLLQRLRSRLLTAAGSDPLKDPSLSDGRRLYLSRQGTPSKRGVENHDKLLSLLVPHGFTEYRMEELPLRDQIRAAAEATHIVAPHGAGLFHTLFMPGGHVVELYPVDENGRATHAPWWNRIIDVHEGDGRRLFWRALDSRIVRKLPTDPEGFSIEADLLQIDEFLLADARPLPNRWERYPLPLFP